MASNATSPQAKMTLPAFVRLMLRNWYWFILALFIAGVGIKLKSRSTVVGNNRYRMAVMTRFPMQVPQSPTASSVTVNASESSEAPLWKHVPAFDATQIYGWIVSADIIHRAGKHLGFEVDYLQKDLIFSKDIYNYIPFKILFPDALDTDQFSLTAHSSPEGITVSKISGIFQGRPIVEGDPILVPWEGEAQSPVGLIRLEDNPGWEEYGKGPYKEEKPITIVRKSVIETRAQYDWDMQLSVEMPNFLNSEFTTTGSARRAKQLLSEMLVELDSIIRYNLTLDLNKEQEMIEAALKHLTSPDSTTTYLSVESRVQEIKALQAQLARTLTNREVLRYDHLLEVTATPALQPAPGGKLMTSVVLLLLALIIPTLLIYYVWLMRGTVLEINQLTSYWREKIQEGLRLHRSRHDLNEDTEAFDRLRLYLQTQQESGDKKRPIVFTTPSESLAAQRRLNKLVTAIATKESTTEKGENTHKIIHLGSQTESTLPHFRSISSGYWGSIQFYQDIATSEEPIWIIAPSDAVSLIAPHAAQIIVVVEQDQSKTSMLSSLERDLAAQKNPIVAVWVRNAQPFSR